MLHNLCSCVVGEGSCGSGVSSNGSFRVDKGLMAELDLFRKRN